MLTTLASVLSTMHLERHSTITFRGRTIETTVYSAANGYRVVTVHQVGCPVIPYLDGVGRTIEAAEADLVESLEDYYSAV